MHIYIYAYIYIYIKYLLHVRTGRVQPLKVVTCFASDWIPQSQFVSQMSLKIRSPGQSNVKRQKWPISALPVSACFQCLTCQSLLRYLTVV